MHSSGKKKKHQLQTMKKIVGSRNGVTKDVNDKLRQKSAEIIKKGELIPRSPNLPMPEQKPELQIVSSARNSPPQAVHQRKTP